MRTRRMAFLTQFSIPALLNPMINKKADALSAILLLICSHEVWVKVAYDWSTALRLCRPSFQHKHKHKHKKNELVRFSCAYAYVDPSFHMYLCLCLSASENQQLRLFERCISAKSLRNLRTSRGPSWPFLFLSLEFC